MISLFLSFSLSLSLSLSPLQGDLTNLVHGSHCSKYRLTRIPGTNAFAGIVNETCDSLAFCACSTVDRLCLNCHRSLICPYTREGFTVITLRCCDLTWHDPTVMEEQTCSEKIEIWTYNAAAESLQAVCTLLTITSRSGRSSANDTLIMWTVTNSYHFIRKQMKCSSLCVIMRMFLTLSSHTVFFFFLPGWSRMNASVHVSAPWRSTSAQATSPTLKTGQCSDTPEPQ